MNRNYLGRIRRAFRHLFSEENLDQLNLEKIELLNSKFLGHFNSLAARCDYNTQAIVELQHRLDKLEDSAAVTPQAMRQLQLRYEADLRQIRSDWRATLYTQQQALLGAARALAHTPIHGAALEPAVFQGPVADLALTHPYRTLLPEALDAQARTGQASWLDLGCATGSWMQELAAAGITPRGVDHRHAVAAAQVHGLVVQVANECHALEAEQPGKLAGISAFYLLERMSPQDVPKLIAAAWAALAPGGVLMLSGANPENLAVAVFGLWAIPERTRLWLPKTLADYTQLAGFNPPQLLRWRLSNSGALLLDADQPAPASRQAAADADPDQLINQARCAPEHWALFARKPA